jgi:hypothetical protein
MKKLPLVFFLAVLAVFAFGVVRLLNLRFEKGDNYPAYSSFRADPLGTKALFESLDQLISVDRNLKPLAKLGEGRAVTLLWLGADARDWRFQREEFRRLETFIRTGGRMVVGFLPAVQRPWVSRFPAGSPRARGPGGPPMATNAPPVPSSSEWEESSGLPATGQWNFALNYADLIRDEDKRFLPAAAFLRATDESNALPHNLPVHTTLYFDQLDPAWRVIYSRFAGTNQQPVLVARRFGKGSLVLVADAYPFSNEALLKDRESALLSWLVGPNQRVLFDETHLGTQTTPGIAALARQYRLHGFFAALLILAGLFLWKNGVSFIPPDEDQLAGERRDVIEGKDSAAGFVNLLRRNIAPADLMKVCLEQWNLHSANTRKPAQAKLEAMQRIIDEQNALEPKQRDPVGTYNKFQQILSKSSGFRVPGSELKQSNEPH